MMGLASRKKRNDALRALGQPITPGWDAGVKRMARFIKTWPAIEIDPDRLPLYRNHHVQKVAESR